MILLLLALAPALALTLFYYHRDKHPEPWGWVGMVFVLGALATLLALPLQVWAYTLVPQARAPGGRLFLECLLIPGCIEETVKLLVVVAAVWWRPDFNDPVDGLVYGTACALGFAFAEDWRYYLIHGPDFSRVFSVAAHPWFSCFWAAALGWTRRLPMIPGLALLALGLGASILVHALFDFLVIGASLGERWGWLRHFIMPLLVGLYLVVELQLETLQKGKAQDT